MGSRRGREVHALGQAVAFDLACVEPGDGGDGCGGRPLLCLLCQEEEGRTVTFDPNASVFALFALFTGRYCENCPPLIQSG